MIYTENLKVLFQVIKRDFYVFGKRLTNYGLNYLLIYPVLIIITFGYLQPGIYFGNNHAKVSIVLLVGTFAVNMLSLCFNMMSPFLYDLEADRFIDYQILLLPSSLLLAQMILFPALLASLISLPFFPLAYLLLPSYFNSLHTNWPAVLMVAFCSALCCASYIMMALCLIKNSHGVRRFWLRYNWPLVVLGGLWIPWGLLKQYSQFAAILALADPLTYITEGMRSALVGTDQFISYKICIFALLIFFCMFSVVAGYFFKKKLDHI